MKLSFLFQKLLAASLLYDTPILKIQYPAAETDAGQSMSDKHTGLFTRQLVNLLVKLPFRNGIQRCRRLIQHHTSAVLQQGSYNSKLLALSSLNIHPDFFVALSHILLYAIRQTIDFLIQTQLCQQGFCFRFRILPAKHQVLPYGIGKQPIILKHWRKNIPFSWLSYCFLQ